MLKKKACFLPFLSEKCTKCQQKAAKCCVIFYMSSIENFQFLTCFDNFLLLVKSKMAPKMAAILDNVTDPPAARQP